MLALGLALVLEFAVAETARVVRVIDGDTFLTGDSVAVRMLGIDAAETYQPGGDVGTEMLAKYIEGRTVRLEPDRTDKDKFGRLLRYVWTGDTFVNLLMVSRGYAPVVLYEDSLKHADTLRKAEEQAATAGVGLWAFNVFTPPSIKLLRARVGTGDSGVVQWFDAGLHLGEAVVVEGRVVGTYRSDKVLLLNFHENYSDYFKVAVFATDLGSFPEKPEQFYKGKLVRVTGIIKEYKGAPEMIVKDAGQISVVEE